MRALLVLPPPAPKPCVCIWHTFHVCVVLLPDGTISSLCPTAALETCDHAQCHVATAALIDLPPALEAELRALAARALDPDR